MNEFSDPRAGAPWPTRAAPRQFVKIYMRDDMVGVGKVRLLSRLAKTGSVAAAAADMGVAMERAWFLLETLQACFEAPLFYAKRGAETEPAEVTALGRDLIARHDAHLAAIDAVSGDFLAWLETVQREGDAPLEAGGGS